MIREATYSLVPDEEPRDQNKRSLSFISSTNLVSCETLPVYQEHLLVTAPVLDAPIRAARSFVVHARGHDILRHPFTTPQQDITIDAGDDPLHRPTYTSNRGPGNTGDSILRHRERAGCLITTQPFLSCSPPKIRRVCDPSAFEDSVPIILKNPSWRSHALRMMDPKSGMEFEWAYRKSNESQGERQNVLALKLCKHSLAVPSQKGKLLAILVRSKSSRTPGTSAMTAGNGGLLTIDQDAARWIDEEIIIATMLIMLRREIGERRKLQIGALTLDPGRSLFLLATSIKLRT